MRIWPLVAVIACAVPSAPQTASFQPPVTAFGRGSAGPLQTVPFGLIAADLNGDGKPDLVDVPRQRSGINVPLVSLGAGDGTFRAAEAPRYIGFFSYGVVVADFDRDGKPDVAGFTDAGSAAVFRGNGDGTLGEPVLTPVPAATPAPVYAADVNGDGRPDLLFGRFLLLGNGDGTFTPGPGFPDPVAAVGDFNRDAARMWCRAAWWTPPPRSR